MGAVEERDERVTCACEREVGKRTLPHLDLSTGAALAVVRGAAWLPALTLDTPGSGKYYEITHSPAGTNL